MPKREVDPFIFNMFIFNSKCGPFKSLGTLILGKITPIFGFTHMLFVVTESL